MGLADRFKDSLEKNNIFEVKKSEAPVLRVETSNTLEYASNPIKRVEIYEDFETEIISKIRKTPYWNEYSALRQRKMIEAYFSKKYKNSNYTEIDKENFIQNILILSNNK